MHPGPEHGPDQIDPNGGGLRGWNRGNHARKFMIASGEWTVDPAHRPTAGRLVFWGEWEPQSEVTPLPARDHPPFPRWLHTPQLDLDAIIDEPEAQNTDPLVFGDRFFYTLCRQYRGGHRTVLSQLDEGDIVLFGSRLHRAFVLDTLLVVGIHSELYDVDGAPDWGSELHQQVTIDRIPQIPPDGLRMYGGEPWSKTRPFSFAPCVAVTGVPIGFPRPTIEPEGALLPILSGPLPLAYRCTLVDAAAGHAAWREVVRQVLAQGCALGTRVDEPLG
jgi:hypothetical protein